MKSSHPATLLMSPPKLFLKTVHTIQALWHKPGLELASHVTLSKLLDLSKSVSLSEVWCFIGLWWGLN